MPLDHFFQALRVKQTADEKKQSGNAKYEQNDFK